MALLLSTGKSRSASISSSGDGASTAGTAAGGSFISKMLLANVDALCAAASPLLELEDIAM